MSDPTHWLDRTRRIAEDVLFRDALAVDTAERIPAGHLDLLAEEGFYGVAAPLELGGLGVEDMQTAARLLEIMASGCLATSFVWMQHHGAVIAATFSQTPGLRDAWLKPLARGERRAGIAYGAVRPGPPSVRARRIDGGWLFTGEVPWVTGWDMIDTVHVAARDEADTVVYALLDAEVGGTLTVEPLDLVAVNASRTVLMRLADHAVPDDRVTGCTPHAEVLASDASGLRLNGSLALGVVDRCCRLIGPTQLDADLDAARAVLDAANAQTLPAARAAASALAVRAAAALTVSAGATAVLKNNHAQRLVREAAFLLVFGSRPGIRAALLERLR